MEYKLITLQNDPWSEGLKNYIRSLPHYKTVLLWENNIKVNPKDTPYYQNLLDYLKQHGQIWGGILKSEEDILKQTNSFYEMYKLCPNWATDTMYKYEISHRTKNDINYYYGYYPLKVKNNGELELYDARHRCSILMGKGLELPQFTLCEREPEWQTIYNNVLILYPTKRLYHPIPHPDFQEFNQGRPLDKEKNIEMIVKSYGISSAIDLGTCHGYTLYALKHLLKTAIGVEYCEERYDIAKIVLESCNYQCYHSDILKFLSEYPNKIDCVFALAVFHHFIKQNTLEDFNKLLKTIAKKANYLLLELPVSSEPQFQWIPENLRNNFFEYIKDQMKFKEICKFIYNGRDVILLKKNV